MVKTAMIFVTGIFFLVLAHGIRTAYRHEQERIATCKQTFATIDRTIYSDTGNVMYYVTFTDNGNVITAQTDHYSSETKSLDPASPCRSGRVCMEEIFWLTNTHRGGTL